MYMYKKILTGLTIGLLLILFVVVSDDARDESAGAAPPEKTISLPKPTEDSEFEVQVMGKSHKFKSIGGKHRLTFSEAGSDAWDEIWLGMKVSKLSGEVVKYSSRELPIRIVADTSDRLLGFSIATKPFETGMYLSEPIQLDPLKAYEIKITGSTALSGTEFYVRVDYKKPLTMWFRVDRGDRGVGKQNNQNRVGIGTPDKI